MVEVRYIGQHQPYGMILDVDEERAAKLVELGECEYANKKYADKVEKKIVEEVKEDLPNDSWTEKKIKKWIKDNNIPLQYHISSETKVDILLKIKNYLKEQNE